MKIITPQQGIVLPKVRMRPIAEVLADPNTPPATRKVAEEIAKQQKGRA